MCVLVTVVEVVGVVVWLVVCEVVGVVTSQFGNPPTENISVIALMIAAVASQSEVVSTKYPPNAQSIVGVLTAGPLNSRTA